VFNTANWFGNPALYLCEADISVSQMTTEMG